MKGVAGMRVVKVVRRHLASIAKISDAMLSPDTPLRGYVGQGNTESVEAEEYAII